MVIVSFKRKMPENYNAFCSASEPNKQNPPHRTLDLTLLFRYKHITSLKKPPFACTRREFTLLVLRQLLRPCLFWFTF